MFTVDALSFDFQGNWIGAYPIVERHIKESLVDGGDFQYYQIVELIK